MATVNNRSGFLLVDILLGVAIFAIIIGSLTSGLAFSHREVIGSGDRIRAVYVAEEALEAVRSIRDQDFASLADGTHGLAVENGLWALSGTGYTTEAGYETAVTLQTTATDRVGVTANTSWDFGVNRSGSLVLYSEVVNWRKIVASGDWSTVSADGSYEDAGTPLFNQAIVSGDYLFVTSETSDGGDGLYVFDISNTASPTRVAGSYTLADPAYGLALKDNYLFVAVGASTEINIYDITTPSSLSAGDIVATINVDGTGNVRGLELDGDTLYVTSAAGAGAVSLASYDVADLGGITQLDTLDELENYNDLAIVDDFIYIATGKDTAELRIVDATSPSFLEYATLSGSYNLTDVSDGLSVQAHADYALVGTANVDIAEEIALFDISPNVLSVDGPWLFEAGAAVNGVDMDLTETYGFIAAENDGKEFSVVDIATFAGGGAPEIATYDTDTGYGRGVYYSWELDRAFLMTNTAVIILKPGV